MSLRKMCSQRVKPGILLTSLVFVLTSLLVVFVQWHTQLAQVGSLSSAQSTNTSSEVQSILLSADIIVASANGGQALLTAIVRDVAGQPVAGAEVHFSSGLGSMSPAIVATDPAGIAISTFTAAALSGQAIITAKSNGLVQIALLQINGAQSETANNTLDLHLGADVLIAGQQIEVTATLLDSAAHPITGELVTFFGSLGEISPASVLSDANGQVKARFMASNMSGQATITVMSGYASKSATVLITNSTATPTPTDQYKTLLPIVSK